MSVHVTSRGHKLGKLPYVPDGRDITFSALKAAAPDAFVLPHLPANFGHGTMFHDGEDPRADWDMNGNGPDDTVEPGFEGAGDCTIAAAAHTTRVAAKLGGHSLKITGASSIRVYSEIGGYVIGDDSTDNGLNMRDELNYRRKVGILDDAGNRHKIGAFVSIDPSEIFEAAWIFSGMELGFEFQRAQDEQFESGTWDYVPGSPVEGGHAIPVFGRNAGRAGAVSWARHVWLTPAFIDNLVDEAYAIVYPDELRAGKNERGYDLTALQAALAAL